VVADGDQRQMRRREPIVRTADRRGRGANLIEAPAIVGGRYHVRDPAVALPARARQRGVRAATDPDRWPGLLRGFRIDADAVELREAALEAGRRVAPERAHDVDGLGHAGAALSVGHAARVELLRILAADAHAEDGPAARERGARGGDPPEHR